MPVGLSEAEYTAMLERGDNFLRLEVSDKAVDRMQRLIKDPEFRAKYERGDEAAVGLYDRLIQLHAEGYGIIKSEQVRSVGGDPAGAYGDAYRSPAVVSPERQALINDPEFLPAYLSGNTEARAAWNASGPEAAIESATTTPTEGAGQ
jgi:hypothetical protein